MTSQEAAGLLQDTERAEGSTLRSTLESRVGMLMDRLRRKPWMGVAGACTLAAAVGLIVVVSKAAQASPGKRGLMAGAHVTTSSTPVSASASTSRAATTAAKHIRTTVATTSSTTTTTTAFLGAAQRKLFRFVDNPDGTVAVKTSSGGYWSVSEDGELSNVASIGEWESFKLLKHGDGTISLRAWTGGYIAAKGDKVKVLSKKGSAEKLKIVKKEDGAIMLETSDGAHVSNEAFSSKPGRFAIYTREAKEAGEAEKFHVEVHSDHTASLKSLHGTYLSADGSGSVVTGSLKVGKQEKFKRHMNKDGTVSLTTVDGGRYLTAFENGTVLANFTKCQELERFQLVKQKDGTVSMKASDGKYLSVSEFPIFTFYMYRAQGDNDYPWQSVNTGNLAGVMWYLHNEVVVETPRKYGISRIVRAKYQVTSTKALSEMGLNFGVRFAYDTGMCTGAGPINGYASCRDTLNKLGNFVGCNYLGDYPFPMASKGFPSHYEGGMWYSLPKEGACLAAPNGQDDCTYFAEDAGSVDIMDLYDMGWEYWDWYNNPDSKEYDKDTDAGVGADFWNGKADTKANKKRVKRALKLFQEKYPDMPSAEDYPDPVCDFNCNRFYKGDELEKCGGECRCSESPIAKWYFDKATEEDCNLDATSGLQNVGYYQGDRRLHPKNAGHEKK